MHKRGDNQTFTELKVTKNKSLEQRSETHAQLSAAPCIYNERISLPSLRHKKSALSAAAERQEEDGAATHAGLPAAAAPLPAVLTRDEAKSHQSRAAPAPALGWEAPNPNPFAVLPFPTPCPGPGERNAERSCGGNAGVPHAQRPAPRGSGTGSGAWKWSWG